MVNNLTLKKHNLQKSTFQKHLCMGEKARERERESESERERERERTREIGYL